MKTGPALGWQGQCVVKPLSTSLYGRQHCVEVIEADNRKIEEVEGTELNGVEEERRRNVR